MRKTPFALAAAALPFAVALHAQNPPAAAQPALPEPIAVGAVAPDFALPGGTRFGTLKNSIRLSDYHGKTIILAFFYRARTRG